MPWKGSSGILPDYHITLTYFMWMLKRSPGDTIAWSVWAFKREDRQPGSLAVARWCTWPHTTPVHPPIQDAMTYFTEPRQARHKSMEWDTNRLCRGYRTQEHFDPFWINIWGIPSLAEVVPALYHEEPVESYTVYLNYGEYAPRFAEWWSQNNMPLPEWWAIDPTQRTQHRLTNPELPTRRTDTIVRVPAPQVVQPYNPMADLLYVEWDQDE